MSPSWVIGRLISKFMPAFGHMEQYFRIYTSTLGGPFHSEASFLQHGLALFLTLVQSALNLRRVQCMSLWQTGQGQLGCSLYCVVVPASGNLVGQCGNLWRSQMALPGVDQDEDGYTAYSRSLTWRGMVCCQMS